MKPDQTRRNSYIGGGLGFAMILCAAWLTHSRALLITALAAAVLLGLVLVLTNKPRKR